MDPLSASQVAAESMSVCFAAAKIIKAAIETIKNINNDLLALAKEIDRCRNTLGMLKDLAKEAAQRGFQDRVHLDSSSLQQCLEELKQLTSNVASTKHKAGKLAAGIHMAFVKSDIAKLTFELREQKNNVMNAVLMINTFATLRSIGDLQLLKDNAERQTLEYAFQPTAVVSPGSNVRSWHGYVNTESFSPAYNEARARLSDAAYMGDWDLLFEVLDEGRKRYNENWTNAFRLKPLNAYDKASHWTPLHQAAFWAAPKEVVQRLVNLGASRTLRSKRSKYANRDQTPLELAKEFGCTHLLSILTPAIQSPVPSHELQALERNFHALMKGQLGAVVEEKHLYLPILEVLTELNGEAVWFEIQQHEFANAGYLFRLDGRDLVVRTHGIHANDEWKDWRITAHDIMLVEQAILINDR